MPLHRVAHGRTGDKGNRSNISVIAWHAELWPLLVEQVTEARVAAQFAHRRPTRVQRYLLPNLQAMNFVLDDVLDGGVNDALNLDSHGKALAFLLLDLPIEVPAALQQHLVGADRTRFLTPTTETRHDSTFHAADAPALAALCALLAVAGCARRPSIPAKPITFVVPFAAGSATDQLARALGQSITADTKQAVVVDNKAGASGMIAAQAAARAAADGYTVLITTNTTHAANEHLYKKLPLRPGEGLRAGHRPRQGRAGAGREHRRRRTRRVADLVAQGEEGAGQAQFGSGSSSSRVAGEMFKQMAAPTSCTCRTRATRSRSPTCSAARST